MRRPFGVERHAIVALELTGNAFEIGAAVLNEQAKSTLPGIGYAGAYAFANIILTLPPPLRSTIV